jgi:predicted component of type VI protein secretion system
LSDFHSFLAHGRPVLVVLSGRATGLEFVLDQQRVSIGRGPGVDLAIDDESLRAEHARLEYADGAFWLVDCAPDSVTRLNGGPVERQALKPNDRLQLGAFAFEYLLEGAP